MTSLRRLCSLGGWLGLLGGRGLRLLCVGRGLVALRLLPTKDATDPAADTADRLPDPLSQALAETAYGLAQPLADAAYGLAHALADAAHRLADAVRQATDQATRASLLRRGLLRRGLLRCGLLRGLSRLLGLS